jgi:hypothetical protein
MIFNLLKITTGAGVGVGRGVLVGRGVHVGEGVSVGQDTSGTIPLPHAAMDRTIIIDVAMAVVLVNRLRDLSILNNGSLGLRRLALIGKSNHLFMFYPTILDGVIGADFSGAKNAFP